MSGPDPSRATMVRLAAVGRLVAPIAHDINNPLTTALGRIQLHLVRGTPGMPRGPGGLDDLYDHVLAVSDKVQTLGGLAREAIAQTACGAVVLADHVGEITHLLGRFLARRGFDLRVDIPPTTPPVVVRAIDLKLLVAEILLSCGNELRDRAALEVTASAQGCVRLGIRPASLHPPDVRLPAEALELAHLARGDGLVLTLEEAFVLSMPSALGISAPRAEEGSL